MIELARKYYPHLNDEDLGDLLIETTCFPFGNPEKVEKNLIELIENTDGTLEGAIEFANEQMQEEWAKHKANEVAA
jgi:hypothetical protein